MSKCYASAVIKTAISQLGYKEKVSNSQLDNPTANAGSGNYTKYARDFDTKYPNWYNGKKNGFAWCDMFVDWCFLTTFGYADALRLLCQPERSAGAGCTYSLAYYRQRNQLFTKPKVGDQIFFGKSQSDVGHTGIVEKVDSVKVYTIEGNTSDMVARRTYLLSDSSIVGYGRPAYDAENAVSTGSQSEPAASAAASSSIKVGDVVDFTGNAHYTNAQAATGKTAKPGKAKVTAIASGKHPYHLVHTDSTSNVYGWVDAKDINVPGTVKKGIRVKVKAGSMTYTGGPLASYVYQNTYDVIQIDGDRVVIGIGSAVTAAVNVKDLSLA